MKQRIVVSTFSLGLSVYEDFPAQRRKDAESEPSAAGGLFFAPLRGNAFQIYLDGLARMSLLKTGMSTSTSEKKRFFEFISLSLLIGFAAALATLVFLGWLIDQVFEGDSVQFDEATRAAVHEFASPAATVIMRGLSVAGSTLALTIGTIIVVIVFAWNKWGREAKLFTLTMIGAALLNMTLKVTFKRARPTPFFDLLPPETYSFPSGHSLASCCFFGALAAIVTAHIRRKRPRAIVWILASVMFLSIGLSRIYLGVHHTTDVIAGFAAAFVWIMVVRAVELQLERRKRHRQATNLNSDT